jgi:hypothetical protein
MQRSTFWFDLHCSKPLISLRENYQLSIIISACCKPVISNLSRARTTRSLREATSARRSFQRGGQRR